MAKKASILIATPTPGTVRIEYMKSVLGLIDYCTTRHVQTAFTSEEGSDVGYQRNVLATRFLLETEFTHLLFIDADMMFAPEIGVRMLQRELPIVGVIYPKKTLNLAALEDAMKQGLSFVEAVSFAYDWLALVTRDPTERLSVADGLLAVARLGFGVTLIRRDVLQTMIDKGVVAMAPHFREGVKPSYNFFSTRLEAATKSEHISEDASFCDRWVLDCGGKLFAMVDTPVFHIGDIGLGGLYFDHLRSVKKLQSKATVG